MGLFSSKKKTVVGTSVSRLIEDKMLPNSAMSGGLRAILREADFPEEIVSSLANSIGARGDRLHDYGKNGYVFGLPSGEFMSGNTGALEVQQVLQGLEGQAVELDYCAYGPLNIQHVAWLKLVRDYGYNSTTNKLSVLSAQKGFDVFLDKIEVVLPAATASSYAAASIAQWGTPSTAGYSPLRTTEVRSPLLRQFAVHPPIVVSSSAVTDFARATVGWNRVSEAPGDGGQVGTLMSEVIVLGNEEYPDGEYFHARYKVAGQYKYWVYKTGTGTYPVLDQVMALPPIESGDFFPMVHFRNGMAPMDTNKASAEYKSLVRACDTLDLDFQELHDLIHENPDIGQVEQAYLTMAVPANSKDPTDLRYLYDFMSRWHDAGGSTPAGVSLGIITSDDWLYSTQRPESALVIRDPRMQIHLVHYGMRRRVRAGNVGPVGTVVSVLESIPSKAPARAPIKSHSYRKQVTAQTYEEIQVLGLEMRYQVRDNYWAGADGADDIVMIPLDRSITKDYSLPVKELLYARSLHFVFNALQVVKLKWYQRAGWGVVMRVAAVVLLIASLGEAANEAAAAWAAAAEAGTAAAVWAVISVVIQNVVLNYVMARAFALLVNVIGIDLAVVAAIVAAAAGVSDAIQSGGIKGAPFAKDLLVAANGLLQGASLTISAELDDLLKEQAAWEEEKKTQEKLLEDAKALLEKQNTLSPYVIFGESPSDYYKRTVHSGNVGTIGFDAIHNYVELALTLPKFSDTVEGP